MAEQIGYEFTADDRKLLESLHRFSNGLDEIRADAKKLTVDTGKAFNTIIGQMNRANKAATGFKNVLAGTLVADVIRRGAEGLKTLALNAVNAAGNYEQLQVAFTTFIGSAKDADKLLEQLTATAAKTPFQQEEIFQGARQLLAYGIEASKVNQQLIDLGNISAGVGQPLDRIVNIFGQITAKGKLTGEELKQLREAGVNPINELAEVTGHAAHEIEGLITTGKISSEAVAQAFKVMTSEGGRFNNLMEKQSATFEGAQSNFKDTVAIVLREFGTGLLPTLKEGFINATKFLQSLDPERVRAFGRDVGKFVSILVPLVKQLAFAVTGFLAFRAIAGLRAMFLGIAGGVNALTTAIKANPIGFVLGTVVALLPQLTTLIRRLSGTTAVMEEMRGVVRELKSDYLDETKAVNDLIAVLTDVNSTQKERNAAIDELRAKYPDILAKYDLEKGQLRDIIDLQKELKDAIIERLREERLGESQKQLLNDLEEARQKKPFSTFLDTKEQKAAVRANAQRIAKEQAIDDFKERNAIIESALSDLQGINTSTLTGTSAAEIEKQQKVLDDARKKEIATRAELAKLDTQALRDISKTKDVDEVRKKLAIEILKAREAEGAANHKSAAELAKAAKALEKYNDAIRKVAEDIAKANADNITDPFLKLAAEKQIALDQNTLLFKELREEAKKVGKDITEVEKLETQARLAIEKKFFEELKELNKKRREEKLQNFLELSQLNAELNNQATVDRGGVPSDGINTSKELTQVKILEEDRARLEIELGRIIEVYGIFSAEAIQAQIDYNNKITEITDARHSNAEAVIDREEKLLLDEVDLIRKSGDSSLTLEEYKERKRLEIQLEFARQRLELLQAQGFGENSPEVRQVKSVIAAYENALKHFGEGDIFDKIKDKIADVFNIDRDVLDQVLQQFGTIFSNLQQLVSDNTQFRIDEERRLLEETRDLIEEKKEELTKEQEDVANGYAGNVKLKEDELAALRIEEKKHKAALLKAEKSALKQKLAADAAAQVSNLITMVSNVVNAESNKGLLGIATAVAGITGFLLLFSQFKNQSKALNEKALFKGERLPLDGFTDKQGGKGHRIEGTNIKVGRGEWIVNDKSSEIHDNFLHDLNGGKYDHLELDKLLSNHKKEPVKIIPLSRDIAKRVQDSNIRTLKSKHAYEHRMRNDAMKEAFTGEVSRLIDYMKKQPQLIPWVEGQIGYIEKRGNDLKRRKFGT